MGRQKEGKRDRQERMNKKINHKTTKDLIGLPGPTDDHLGRMREVEIDLGIRKMFVGNAKIYSM